MALPTLSNISVKAIPAPVGAGILPTNSAYVCFSPGNSGTTKTCNLQSDTMIYTPDGSIWDDTQGAYISVDITSRRPTPRVQDGN